MTQSAFKGEPFGYTSKGDPILYDKDLDQFAVELEGLRLGLSVREIETAVQKAIEASGDAANPAITDKLPMIRNAIAPIRYMSVTIYTSFCNRYLTVSISSWGRENLET